MLVRTWNLFHGNAVPPEPDSHLEAVVRLAISDGPDVLCLQEVPAWGLEWLGEWSGMAVYGEIAAPPRLGPFPSTVELGYRLTRLNHGLLRSAFSGQANAILLGPSLTGLETQALHLNSRRFRKAQERMLELDTVTRLAWAKERRICQVVRARAADGRGFVIANLHATGLPDDRLSDAEAMRAASLADGLARPSEVCILAGDFNVRSERSRTLGDLNGPEWGFSRAGPNIDHVLVRGARAGSPVVWPVEHRRVDGRVLSDHAPVEVEIR